MKVTLKNVDQNIRLKFDCEMCKDKLTKDMQKCGCQLI